MKKLIVVLIIAAMGINSVLAANNVLSENDKKASIRLVQTVGDQQTTLVFEYDTFKDLLTFDTDGLTDLLSSKDEDCTVTATVTVSTGGGLSGDIGVASTNHSTQISISASVTASCSEIKDAIKKLIADLRAALGI